MKEGDRLVLQSEITTNGGPYSTPIPANTVCTMYTLKTDTAIIRYGTDKETRKPKIIGVSPTVLREPTEEELRIANFTELVPESFFLGSQFRVGQTKFDNVKPNDILTINDVKLAANENDDIITFDSADGGVHKLKRQFVDMYFYKYDPEVEAKFGDEVITEDMKTAPRNYYLLGARMFMGPYEDKKVVILKDALENEVFYVEDVQGAIIICHKDSLAPITAREMLLTLPMHDVLPEKYLSGNKLRALETVAKHFLLKSNVQPGDVIEINHNDSLNCNALEDIYEVTNGENIFNISYAELEKYFEAAKQTLSITKEESQQFEESQVIKEVPQRTVHMKIHEVSIYGFRFKIEEDTIMIDGKEFHKADISSLIKALTELKENIL